MISSLIMPEVFIQGGEGKLQAKYSPSEQEKPNIAIILHPCLLYTSDAADE